MGAELLNAGLQMEILLMRAVDNRGIGYLAYLLGKGIEISDGWYWHGVCEALKYSNSQWIEHVEKLKRALEAENGR